MAGATRARGREGLNHFIHTVLDVPPKDATLPDGNPDHPIHRYLEVAAVISVTQLAFHTTEYKLTTRVLHDTGGVDITGTIDDTTIERILALKAWIRSQPLPNNCHTELMALTYDTYEDFRLEDAMRTHLSMHLSRLSHLHLPQ